MTQLTKRTPLTGISTLFSDFFDNNGFFPNIWGETGASSLPAVNVKETENTFELEVAAPGYSKKDFNVEIENGVLNISAKKSEEKSEEKKNFTRKEFNYSSFNRSFSLPETINESNINANYKDGILFISLAKKEETLKRSKKAIDVQ